MSWPGRMELVTCAILGKASDVLLVLWQVLHEDRCVGGSFWKLHIQHKTLFKRGLIAQRIFLLWPDLVPCFFFGGLS